MQSFGPVISSHRKAKRITQEELALHMKVERAAVSQWELGKTWPDDQKLAELERFFGLPHGTWLGMKHVAQMEKISPGATLHASSSDLTPEEKIWLSFYRTEAWDKATRFMIEKRAAAMMRAAEASGKPVAEIVEVASPAPARMLADSKPSPKKRK